jgi:geranylgeranyl diphosphate synthase type 3
MGNIYCTNESSHFIDTAQHSHLEHAIRGPYDYIASQPGKEFRTLLLNAFNVWLEVKPESLEVITEAVRMLHTASLLIDDIQDNSNLRRGMPTAHRIFGVPQTINSGNYVYFLALQHLQQLKNKEAATQIFIEEVIHLHRGQGMDLFWRDMLSCPTEEEYLEMVSNKTGGLFRLAIRLMQSESETGINVLPLVQLFGLIFQIADDYHNLTNKDYTAKKGVYEDLTEGKFSFPVIHHIRSAPNSQQLLNILAQRTEDLEMKKVAVKCIEGTGSLEYTKEIVALLVEEAKVIVRDLGGKGNPLLLMLLEKIGLK